MISQLPLRQRTSTATKMIAIQTEVSTETKPASSAPIRQRKATMQEMARTVRTTRQTVGRKRISNVRSMAVRIRSNIMISISGKVREVL